MNIITISRRFDTHAKCIKHLELTRWNGTPLCAYCSSNRTTPIKKEKRHHCNACNKSFSVLIGTIFEDTHLELPKWFIAICLILNAKKGISSRQLARDINVNKDTAWYMQMRIRKAMKEGHQVLKGIVEVDETYVGGDLINKTKKYRIERDSKPRITGKEHKQPVIGFLQRSGRIITRVVPEATVKTIKPLIEEIIDKGSVVVTDGFGPYRFLKKEYKEHVVVNHQNDEFVKGEFHTNTIEGFWSLVKRSIIGQYHRVSDNYLHRYLDECSYKYNNRNNKFLFENFMPRALGLNTT